MKPAVELLERRGVDRVQPARADRSHGREPAVPEHLQVLRDSRLRDAELRLHDRGDVPRGDLAIGEELEDPASDRVTEDVERVHLASVEALTYISQACNKRAELRAARSGRGDACG